MPFLSLGRKNTTSDCYFLQGKTHKIGVFLDLGFKGVFHDFGVFRTSQNTQKTVFLEHQKNTLCPRFCLKNTVFLPPFKTRKTRFLGVPSLVQCVVTQPSTRGLYARARVYYFQRTTTYTPNQNRGSKT